MRHVYLKRNANSPYMEAPPEVVNAIRNPCTYKAPPPDSNCPPNAFDNAPIKVQDNSSDMAGDWTAQINYQGMNQMVLSTNNNADVLEYNKDLDSKNLAKRMASEFGAKYGGQHGCAKNKKNTKRRSNRVRKASRRKASRRKASRRKASRRHTGNK